MTSFIPEHIRNAVLDEGRLHLLAEYDRKNDTSLMKTLRVYLSNVLDSRKTSEELCVHRNTLLNILERIEEVCGIRLSDRDDVMECMAYFVMERYRSLSSPSS